MHGPAGKRKLQAKSTRRAFVEVFLAAGKGCFVDEEEALEKLRQIKRSWPTPRAASSKFRTRPAYSGGRLFRAPSHDGPELLEVGGRHHEGLDPILSELGTATPQFL